MDFAPNRFKQGLQEGRLQIGLWSHLANHFSTEIISQSGFDWIVLDMEHGPNDLPDLIPQMQAMKGGTASAVIRPPWNDFVVIKRLLDAGAPTILVPYVQSRAEAEAAVAAIRYPPHGIRGVAGGNRASGFGRIPQYLHHAHEHLALIVQIETAQAMDQLEEIATVKGVDGVFIGPADLSASMGHLGDQGASPVQDAIRQAASRLAAVGTPAGILATADEDIRRYIGWGYRFVAVGSDVAVLARGADALAARYRS